MDLNLNLKTLVELFVGYVIVRGIIVHWLAEEFQKYVLLPVFRRLKGMLIKSERDLAIWLHYRNQAIQRKPKQQ